MAWRTDRLCPELVDLLLERYSGRYCCRSEGAVSHRMEDLNAMMEVAHNRWEAACVAEDTVLAARLDDDAADDQRFAYMRLLILVARQRETVWREYERINRLRQRTMTAC